jgi:trafficking protein particle complex subunit 11
MLPWLISNLGFILIIMNLYIQPYFYLIRHYSQAYAHILELRITDANVNEVKTIAGYVGYKVWKLSFVLNLPREAIAHFKSHLDFFRLRIGHPLTRFEHNAWLAAQ